MDTQGFTEEDFLLELELYDVIRSPDWQSWTNTNVVTTQVSTSVPQTNEPRRLGPPTLDKSKNFWNNLLILLKHYYPEEQAEEIWDIFQAEFDSKMASASLDSLERLAAHLTTPKID